ncbi:hypothetical protein RhiirA5_407008 [Rhizophagus irregularis]|uniref:Uncharacterized protein n=1 Tax=Rhizophagus irregularis TaxID=588596 RepID=A0A2I1FBP0_9GLOM|nr:hypothetical protein RhiirA5_407008 [Rhizophagus irregularis]PKC56959.1 hypothetical protein RhiirA1_473243 [Rhizophagus irregularis]PKK63849.1 hypothetical protein RhiirC2_788334 [Rhizophagus irregularis]PKY31815.1 hypothetical protein RhiirB3_449619 [Rhizophagus irregularis]CAB4396609.1 unnamed protein product [Rhizophagus irregularis]
MCRFLHLAIFLYITFIPFNIFALECNPGINKQQNDEADKFCAGKKGSGYVCVNTDPGKNTCVYACHSDIDCKTNKCDKTTALDRPHWLCSCNGYRDCYGITGYCSGGHCH